MGSFCPVCNQFVENLDVCEDYYSEYTPYECSPYEPEPPPPPQSVSDFTRSKTSKIRLQEMSMSIKPLLDSIDVTDGIENKLEIVREIYKHVEANIHAVRTAPKLNDICKSKLVEFLRDYPKEAGFLFHIKNKLFPE
jgi:hypothetical protein